jgi:hypothetical protein
VVARGQASQPPCSLEIGLANRVNTVDLGDEPGIQNQIDTLSANQFFYLPLAAPTRRIHIDANDFVAHQRRGK